MGAGSVIGGHCVGCRLACPWIVSSGAVRSKRAANSMLIAMWIFSLAIRKGTTWDELGETGYYLQKALPDMLKLKVDLLHMRNLEVRGYVMLQALLTAKTIYEGVHGSSKIKLLRGISLLTGTVNSRKHSIWNRGSWSKWIPSRSRRVECPWF